MAATTDRFIEGPLSKFEGIVYRYDGRVGIGNGYATDAACAAAASRCPEELSDAEYAVLGVAQVTPESMSIEWFDVEDVE